jgi:1-acyl-sn-glycerol-3-phosphate acyltransferase
MADRVYRGVVTAAMGVFRGLGLRFDVVGAEHAPATGGGVLVMNHTGYADFALAGAPFWWERRRLVRFMAKKEVFAHPVSGPLMRAMRHIPVDRAAGGQAFRDAVSYLKDGEIVGVFPEATISRSFCLKEFKSGAVAMARAASVPILPMGIWGSQRLWTKDRKPTLRGARHIPIVLTLGEPIDPKATADPTGELLAAMEKVVSESRARYPDDGAGQWWQPAHLGGTAPTPERAQQLDELERAERAARREAKAAQAAEKAARRGGSSTGA